MNLGCIIFTKRYCGTWIYYIHVYVYEHAFSYDHISKVKFNHLINEYLRVTGKYNPSKKMQDKQKYNIKTRHFFYTYVIPLIDNRYIEILEYPNYRHYKFDRENFNRTS